MRYTIVDSFPDLGIKTAFHFLRWVQVNPHGVISLPTGKTPEYFIRSIDVTLKLWTSVEVQELAAKHGLSAVLPDTSNLKFVQMDEFIPHRDPNSRSFSSYVRKYYIAKLGIKPENCLLMDLEIVSREILGAKTLTQIFPRGQIDFSLRHRAPNSSEEHQQSAIWKLDKFCDQFESKIREWGGIGFFLGGLGPDGHVAFNIFGSSIHSTTRLCEVNYQTRAAAAGDLGGIDAGTSLAVMTIGLGTISFNPDCECVIFAAGEAKARAVSSCEGEYAPVGLLAKKLDNFQLFLTRGAAKYIHEERLRSISVDNFESEICRLFTSTNTPLSESLELQNSSDLENYNRILDLDSNAAETVRTSLQAKIEKGVEISSLTGFNFIHFEPHHDDILLGYLPLLLRLLNDENIHFFATCTAGFNSVSDSLAISLAHKFPGLSGEQLKTRIREAESESLWRSLGFGPGNWQNLNLPFYSASIFNVLPGAQDVEAILDLLRSRAGIADCDLIVTVAVDPESSGPDTHYKCLQAITEALVLFEKEAGEKFINIWGYRNVWTNFETSETTALVPEP